MPCYSYVSAEDYCPPLIDNNFDGEPDAPYYNSYAQYGINRPIGGNVLLETRLNLIFKVPFIEDQSQFRTAFFIDLGNVFSTFCYNYQTQCFTPILKIFVVLMGLVVRQLLHLDLSVYILLFHSITTL